MPPDSIAPKNASYSLQFPIELSIGGGLSPSLLSSNFHSIGDFSLPASARSFTSGTGLEIRFPSLSAGLRISPSLMLTAQIQAGKNDTKYKTTSSTAIVDRISGKVIPIISEHLLQTNNYFASLQAGAKYILGSGIFTQLLVGLQRPFSAKYHASETWSYPSDSMFKATQKEAIGSTNETQLMPTAEISVGTALPFARNTELMFSPAFTAKIARNNSEQGNFYSLGAEIRIQWRPQPIIPIFRDTNIVRDTISQLVKNIDTISIIPTTFTIIDSSLIRESDAEIHTYFAHQTYKRLIPQPKALLSADISVKFITADGSEAQSAKVNVEQTRRTTEIPLLPYIFYDKGDTALPKRYLNSDKIFERRYFNSDAVILPLYHSLLQIVSARLKQSPASQLHIKAIASPDDQMRNGGKLAIQRSFSIRKIISDFGGIDTSRLSVEIENAPLSRNMQQESEYRRVELSTMQSEILKPYIIIDTIGVADPPTLRFHPISVAASGTASWSIEIQQDGRLLRVIDGIGDPPKFLDWNINDGENKERLIVAPVSYRLTVVDNDGQTLSTNPDTLVFQQSVVTRDLQRQRMEFSVMCFNYDETNLATASTGQIDYIRSQLPQNANFTLVGATDTIGNIQYNKELSLRRAQVIMRLLGLTDSNAKAIGLGEDATSFDNGLPEGRFYSRRVRIIADYKR